MKATKVQVQDQVGDQVQVRDQIWDQVGENIKESS